MAPGAPSGKNKKKKWSKGKSKEKANNAVFIMEESLKKIVKEVSTYRLVTPSVIADRHHLNGSLARRVLSYMEAEGNIRLVSKHGSQLIYTRATIAADE